MQLAGTCRHVGCRRFDPGVAGHGGVKVVDARLDARAHVAQKAAPPVAGPGECIDHVVHEHEIAGLLAVPEDHARLAGQKAAGKNGDHAGLSVKVLAWAVDVGEGQGRVLEPVQLAIQVR